MIAHDATKARPENKATAVQVVEVGSDHAEQSAEVPLAPSLVRMELEFGRFRLDDRPDLQAAFLVAGCTPVKLNMVFVASRKTFPDSSQGTVRQLPGKHFRLSLGTGSGSEIPIRKTFPGFDWAILSMASHRNFTPSLESLKRSTDRVFAVRPGEPVGFKPSPLGGQSVTAPTEGT